MVSRVLSARCLLSFRKLALLSKYESTALFVFKGGKRTAERFLATSKSHHFRLKWSLISEKAFVADVPPSTAISITWFFSAFCSYSYNQGDYGNINQIVLHPLSILRFL